MININGHKFNNKELNEHSMVIDIGALYGVFSEPILREFNCYVEAYEPSKDNFEKLSKIDHPKFTAVNKAVSNYTGEANFNVFGYGWDGGSNTLIKSKRKPVESYKINVISLNDVLKSHDNVDLLKLDCEGSEKDILLNTDLDLLSKCKQVVVEFHTFRDYFGINKKDVKKITERLSEKFDYRLSGGHPDCLFIRKKI